MFLQKYDRCCPGCCKKLKLSSLHPTRHLYVFPYLYHTELGSFSAPDNIIPREEVKEIFTRIVLCSLKMLSAEKVKHS